ncbi:transmembrane protein 62-like isoform X2 [Ctenocephalides felis]|uniref:transmembrane protein 62-like isoform X2 n=1 Tax=Ctenocephalides felis TaxID=7515 RepID=UPI000E6E5564|nr:transmembrane protein 62-like isoform X2 [Ctenocephalides felis]
MRISKSAIFFLLFILIFSILVANVANLVNVNDELQEYDVYEKRNQPWIQTQKQFPIKDSADHLIWFLQISDIHISIFHDPSRISELREFCHKTVDIIKPIVVLASGDLTDAKSKNNMGSRQFEKEWEYYRNILEETKVLSKTKWLDIRGNHDNFNIAGVDSKQNYYYNYSVQGRIHKRSYLHQISLGNEKYSFIALDASLTPGPRRPFNFVGMITKAESEYAIKLAEEARASGGNYTIWFGHYPTSCIIAPGGVSSVRSLIGRYTESMAYLCGHLHRMGGLVPTMHTIQKSGFLELELGDWKDNRMIRLMAIDHGLFSFIDAPHGRWPLILITNPKHALYAMPKREAAASEQSALSTHIRLLAFSIGKITHVKVRINEQPWTKAKNVKGPLFVSKWNAENYKKGLHHIHVEVEDEDGRIQTISQPFSLDGTRLSFDLLPRFILMSNASQVFQFMFAFMLVMCIVPLCLFRLFHRLVKDGRMRPPRMNRSSILCLWMRKLWVLASVDRIYYPLIAYPIYLTCGPWSVGEIIEGHLGAIFAWGIVVNGSFLPGSFTYFYGYLQMFLCQFPMTLILANCVDKRTSGLKHTRSLIRLVINHIPFILIVSIQMLLAYFFWLAYGTLAFIIGPLRTWSIFLNVLLWWQAITLPEKCTRDAAAVWSDTCSKIVIDANTDTADKNTNL